MKLVDHCFFSGNSTVSTVLSSLHILNQGDFSRWKFAAKRFLLIEPQRAHARPRSVARKPHDLKRSLLTGVSTIAEIDAFHASTVGAAPVALSPMSEFILLCILAVSGAYWAGVTRCFFLKTSSGVFTAGILFNQRRKATEAPWLKIGRAHV